MRRREYLHTGNKLFLQNVHHRGSLLAALPFPSGQCVPTPPPQPQATAGAAVLLIFSPARSFRSRRLPLSSFPGLNSQLLLPPPLHRKERAARSLPTYRTTPPTTSPSHTVSLSLASSTPPARSSRRCAAQPCPLANPKSLDARCLLPPNRSRLVPRTLRRRVLLLQHYPPAWSGEEIHLDFISLVDINQIVQWT